MYLVNTRANIYFAVNQLNELMFQPSKLHRKVTKHVLRYLIGTKKIGLWYKNIDGVKLQGLKNEDWAHSPSDRKRTLGVVFSVGSITVSRYNKKHRSIPLNSTKAKYMASSQATCEVIWMMKILIGFFSQGMEHIEPL